MLLVHLKKVKVLWGKIVAAAFWGMHVSPAKHSYASVTDRQTDRHTDGRTTDKVIPMCRYASQATQKYESSQNVKNSLIVTRNTKKLIFLTAALWRASTKYITIRNLHVKGTQLWLNLLCKICCSFAYKYLKVSWNILLQIYVLICLIFLHIKSFIPFYKFIYWKEKDTYIHFG